MAVGAVSLLAAAAAFFLLTREPARSPIAGMVRQTEIRIAPEVSGRLVTLDVHKGQTVTRGELLAVLDNPELAATLGEARAAAASARAERDHVFAGPRAEQVATLQRSVETAEANLVLARQEQTRAVALAARDFASRQKLDESDASLAKATADLSLKQAMLGAARAGPTAEERALAEARVALAESKVADVAARLAKLRLVSPVDGTVDVVVARPGEVVPVGKPVLTLTAAGDRWFAFTIREDALGPLTVGSAVTLYTDRGQPVAGKVTELRPLGEFATWRAARAVGDHDLNSFRLRIDPTGPVDGLESGMTVWLR